MFASQAYNGAEYSLRSVFDDLKRVLSILWRGRYWIAATTLAFVIPVAAYLLITPTQYEATAQVMLDPRQINLVDGAVVSNNLGESSVGADTLLVDSQTEIINSRAIVGPVIRAHKLTEDREFIKPHSLGIRSRLRNLLGTVVPGFEPERLPTADPVELVLQNFRRDHLSVRRVGNTYLINIAVLSTGAEKAARLANAIADTYIRDQVAFLSKTTRVATADLESRIKEMRERVRVAEEKVEVFRAESGLVGGPGLLVTEQQLQELNTRLATARAETGLAKARHDKLSRDTAESIAAGNTSQALDNKVIVNLRAVLAQAERRLSGLSGELGPAHPSLRRAREEKASVLRLIEQELNRIRAVAKSEYDLALANEKSLEKEFQTARQHVSENNSSLVRLRELEREASATKAVLESFLVRAKETNEQQGLARPNSRVIASAAVPQRPAYPPTKLIAAAALFFGMFTGAALVWLRHVLSAPPAGQVQPATAYYTAPGQDGLLIEYGDGTADTDILSDEVLDAFEERLKRLRQQSRNTRPPSLTAVN